MRAIINNLLYDTETSKLIYSDVQRARYYYKTPNNGYFVMFKTGEIDVITEETVKILLGRYDIDKYIELFGAPKKG